MMPPAPFPPAHTVRRGLQQAQKAHAFLYWKRTPLPLHPGPRPVVPRRASLANPLPGGPGPRCLGSLCALRSQAQSASPRLGARLQVLEYPCLCSIPPGTGPGRSLQRTARNPLRRRFLACPASQFQGHQETTDRQGRVHPRPPALAALHKLPPSGRSYPRVMDLHPVGSVLTLLDCARFLVASTRCPQSGNAGSVHLGAARRWTVL